MKAILLSCLLVTITASAFTAQPEKAGPIKAPPQTAPHVYVNPEKVPEHDWDRNLFRTDAQIPSVHLEFLYWKALEGDLSYALKMTQPSWNTGNPGATSASCGTYQNAQFEIDPGFRIGTSFFRAPHYWEAYVQYTRVTSSGDQTSYRPTAPNESLNATWQLPTNSGSAAPLAVASSYVHLNYNVADAFFTRYFHPNPHLRIRILGGFTGAWLNQTTAINYLDTESNNSQIEAKWKYWGAGLRFGMTSDWYWFTDLYMTARLTFAGLIGSYRNQNFQKTSIVPDAGQYDTSRPFGKSDYKDGRAVSNVQMIFGPSWQKAFKNSRIELFAGCEYNMWTNLQETYHSELASPTASKAFWVNSGLLTMVGLTTRLTIDF